MLVWRLWQALAEEGAQPPLHLLGHLDVRRAPGDPDRRAQRPQIGATGRARREVQRDPRDFGGKNSRPPGWFLGERERRSDG